MGAYYSTHNATTKRLILGMVQFLIHMVLGGGTKSLSQPTLAFVELKYKVQPFRKFSCVTVAKREDLRLDEQNNGQFSFVGTMPADGEDALTSEIEDFWPFRSSANDMDFVTTDFDESSIWSRCLLKPLHFNPSTGKAAVHTPFVVFIAPCSVHNSHSTGNIFCSWA